MITDDLTEAIKSLFETVQGDALNTHLADHTIYNRDGATTKTYPSITITDNGSTEDDDLDGVYRVNIEITNESVAAESTDDGTTPSDHRLANRNIFDLMRREAGAAKCDGGQLLEQGRIKVFDIHGNEPSNERNQGRNTTVFRYEIVCCSAYENQFTT